MSSGDIISVKDIALNMGPATTREAAIAANEGLTLKEAKEKLEEKFMKKALEKAHGNVAQVGRELGLSRRHLYERMDHYGIDPRVYK